MLIATKWSGCELQSVKMTDGPQIFQHWSGFSEMVRCTSSCLPTVLTSSLDIIHKDNFVLLGLHMQL